MCLGDELAKMLLFLYCANYVNFLEYKVLEPERLYMPGYCGITLVPPTNIHSVKSVYGTTDLLTEFFKEDNTGITDIDFSSLMQLNTKEKLSKNK